MLFYKKCYNSKNCRLRRQFSFTVSLCIFPQVFHSWKWILWFESEYSDFKPEKSPWCSERWFWARRYNPPLPSCKARFFWPPPAGKGSTAWGRGQMFNPVSRSAILLAARHIGGLRCPFLIALGNGEARGLRDLTPQPERCQHRNGTEAQNQAPSQFATDTTLEQYKGQQRSYSRDTEHL